MSGQGTKAVLRGGPSHGLKVIVLPEAPGRALHCVSQGGYTYRDSGQLHRGLQIYDWLPAKPPAIVREIPRPS